MQRLDETVTRLVAEVLNIAAVSSADDFFALGGTSLSAAVVVTRVESAIGKEVSLRLLLANPVIGDFCQALTAPDERVA